MEMKWSNDIYDMFDIEEEADCDSLHDIIWENFDNIFPQNEYKYAGHCVDSYRKYGFGPNNTDRWTNFYKNIKELVIDFGEKADAVKLYKGMRNRLIMKAFHHDGVETLEIVRLNKKGEERLPLYYDEFDMFDNTKEGNIKNYIRVSCWNDFKEE